MARIDVPDLLKTAARYSLNLSKQEGQKSGSMEALQLEAEMEDRRRDFLRLSERVFFESIVEGSDLLPLRYLGIGQLAAKAVGRIQVSLSDGAGEGFATGFLVAPGLLLTNQHVLRSPSWAAVATLTMDAEDGVDGLPLVPRIFRLAPDRLYVADEKLDFCFVAVEPVPTVNRGAPPVFQGANPASRAETTWLAVPRPAGIVAALSCASPPAVCHPV